MISSPWNDRKNAYDFVIVGSGYGGAVTAARLASAALHPKPSICLLERGREWPAGSFPETFSRLLEENRSSANPLGLYETLHFRDISVIKANGLGGGSLINANVAIAPDAEVFKQGGWPRTLTGESLDPYYERARQVLDVRPHPEAERFPKYQALNRAAAALGTRAQPAPLAVNFQIKGANPYGVEQVPCNNCGDCCTGCNYGGKNSLVVNYLPMARRCGAEIYTQAKVEWIEKTDGGWRIHGTQYSGPVRKKRFQIEARNVVLAAGALNSTEILLRSEMHGLRVSPRLGTGFSGNGDFFAIAYNSDVRVQSLGTGRSPERAQAAPGPAILGVVRANSNGPALERFIVEEGTVPSPYVQAAQIAFAAFRGEDSDTGDEAAERQRVLKDLSQRDAWSGGGALFNTLPLLVTSHDDAQGSLVLESPWWERDGRLKLHWDDAGRQATFARINTQLRRMARALGSTFVENAFWTAFELKRLVTLHPLGGCPLGEDYLHGAVDEYGRVFSGDGSVHEGLFVADGALLPSAIGADPLLTICALAERIVERKIEQLQGREYPTPAVTVGFSPFDAGEMVRMRDQELERLFRRAPSLGIEGLVNTGEHKIDLENRRIWNDTHWKGYLPKGLPLNELTSRLFTGYYKRFWKEGKRYRGETGYLEGRVPLHHALEEINIEKRVNDLDPGRYILLRYTDPVFEGLYYDIMKRVNDDLILYRGYTGQYPNGHRGWTAVLLRSYGFEQMSVEDHRRLFDMGTAPTPEDVEGTWRMDAVANSNHAAGVAYLRFDRKPGGRVESRYRLLNAFEGLVMPSFLADHFQLHDFTAFHDEIRRLDRDYLVGRWVVDLPEGVAGVIAAGSVGLLHVHESEPGRKQFGFYYLLTRSSAEHQPENPLLASFREARLPAGLGIRFEEQMEGWYFEGTALGSADRETARQLVRRLAKPGEPQEGAACRLDLEIDVPDLAAFFEDPAHEARCSGSISFDAWEGGPAQTFPLDARVSHFEYLHVNEMSGEAEIAYLLEFATPGGRRFRFEGRKYMSKEQGGGLDGMREVIEDYTTLYARLFERKPDGLGEAGAALMRFRTFENAAAVRNLSDFLLSFSVTGAADPLLKMRARLAFLAFTARFVQTEYDPLSLDIGTLRDDVRQEVARGAETPDYFSSRPTVELQSVLRESPTLPLESLINNGEVRIDFEKRRIFRDSFWKGSFAKDHILGWEERVRTAALGGDAESLGSLFAGGSFWKRFDSIVDGMARGHVVNYELHSLPGKPEVVEIPYPNDSRRYFRKDDKILLLRYLNQPYRIVYDTIKVIDEHNAIGVMHLGEFPNGIEFATFVMARHNYPFEKMSLDDHRLLFSHPRVRPPSPAELAGEWAGALVFLRDANLSLLNQANPVVLQMNLREAGESVVGTYRIGAGPALSHTWDARMLADNFRQVDETTTIGRWTMRDIKPDQFLELQSHLQAEHGVLEFCFVLTRN